MNAEYYDLNVWSDAPDGVYLTAYEWEDCPSGGLQMNTEKFHTIRIIGFDRLAEIEFLTQDLWLNSYPLTDFDEWRDLDEVYNDNTPPAIKSFIEGLPAYELPTNLIKENA
jgi:hypothetical protein